MQITGGKVTFRRNVQPAQYEGREATVEIGFAVDEGASLEAAQGMLDTAAAMAKSKALELVQNDKITTPPTGAKATTTSTAGSKEATAAKLNAADKEKPKTKPKPEAKGDELPGTPTKGDELPGDKPQISTSPEDRKDPAQTTDPDGLDDVLDLSPSQDVQDYSDKDLIDVVSRVNAKIKNPAKIKEVRAKYTQGAIATIDKTKRAAFVKDIEALAA